MDKHPKRPRDPNQLAKLIVDLATGDATETPNPPPSPRAIAGAAGGRAGGTRRAASLSQEQRSEIARKGAATRWGKA